MFDQGIPKPVQSTITSQTGVLHYEALVHLFDYDAQAPLDSQEVSVRAHDGVTVHDLSYASPKGGRVTAFLVAPDGSGPGPGVLLQHGVAEAEGVSLGRELLLPYALELAKTGAVVLLIDAPFARPPHARRVAGPFTFTEQDRDEQIQLIIDLRRGVDLLIGRADVDTQRMAYIGWSYGAAMGGLLAAVERRLKTYVLAVGSGGVVAHFAGKGAGSEAFHRLPQSQQERWMAVMQPIEPIHYVGYAAPAALFFQAARYDQAVPAAEAVPFQQAGSEPKRITWYDSQHRLNAEAIRDQIGWLQTYIGIDASKFVPNFSR
jgi:dienelactone hydrolase